ncbi:upf0414 transmembrane protein c20orf30-like protein [Syncephalis plumigaleata]|nr:upf0414 transmembrane protein c20orf30-like protein [Syncephalis plumigaleata]
MLPKRFKGPKRSKRSQRESLRYLRLHEEASAFSREQFIKPPSPIPWNSIILASVLFIFGAIGVVIGALIVSGMIDTPDWKASGLPILILGTLIFIPGFYHVRLAYYAWKGYYGYDFDQIPDLE